MKLFEWNDEKNDKLKEERGISFGDIIYYIERGDTLDIVPHPQQNEALCAKSTEYRAEFLHSLHPCGKTAGYSATENKDISHFHPLSPILVKLIWINLNSSLRLKLRATSLRR